MDATTTDGERATGRWVAAQVKAALDAIQAVASTGDEALDRHLLTAEQALRRVLIAAKNDAN